ncbi:MAG: PAS domain-containing protein [Deltaproteobacteria bacterium]|nr:PAS domain-containing protein [Deltaproteobacteria bacterium]MBW2016367.1 PAS domain-containing protein [Deltaproteobacteria bacterium]MBW2304145.1 PAS domain-containing protein [Deltaproteobacteria bacterium]
MAGSAHTIAVLFFNPTDRELLGDFIASLGHRTVFPDISRVDSRKWAGISLVIIDEPTARRHGKRLIDIKKRSETFLGLLIGVREKTVIPLWMKLGFDDVLLLPLTKAELRARLSTLLHVREQSCELVEQHGAMFKALVESSSDHIFILNEKGVFLLSNGKAGPLERGKDVALPGRSIHEVFPPGVAGFIAGQLGRVFSDKEALEFDLSVCGKGEIGYYLFTLFPIFRGDGVWAAGGICRDITRLRQGEERLKATIREKEVLLRELCHRTKNNMQVIMSMLHMQSLGIKDEGVREAFGEIENKIQSMALVHQKLYQGKSLSRVDLKDYIQDLVRYLSRSYREDSERIRIRTDLEGVSVSIDSAVPCGLIINELVSNAFKHAFPGKRKGEILISLKRRGEIELGVGDDGIGLPEGFVIGKSLTLGLSTVVTLVEHQLRGEIERVRAEGTRFRIRFKDPSYKARV